MTSAGRCTCHIPIIIIITLLTSPPPHHHAPRRYRNPKRYKDTRWSGVMLNHLEQNSCLVSKKGLYRCLKVLCNMRVYRVVIVLYATATAHTPLALPVLTPLLLPLPLISRIARSSPAWS